jgi:hypothetical protein
VEPGQGRDVPQQEKGKEGKGIELKGGEGIKDSIATSPPPQNREQSPFHDDQGQMVPPPAQTPPPRPKGPREDDPGDPEGLWHAGIKGRAWARSLVKTGAPIGPGNWLTWWGLLEHCCKSTVEETNHAALVDFVAANFAGKGKKPWPDEVRALWDEEHRDRGPNYMRIDL